MADRLPAVREWRIHLGAHKTATTHLQRTLEAHRDRLVAQGVDFLHFRPFRDMAQPYIRPRSWRRRLWGLPGALMERRFVHGLDRLRRGPDTVLLSDEDLLGYSEHQLDRPLYPGLRAMHLVRHLAEHGERTTLFLAVRSLDGLLPSAYAQALKARAYAPGSMARICAGIAAAPPSWVELIERLRAAVPGAELKVWDYAGYRAHWQQILTLYAGRDVGAFPEVPAVKGTASPAPRAIAEAEALDPDLPQGTRIAQVRALYARWPAGEEHGRLAPLDADAVAALRAHHAAELAEIGRRWPGMLIDPRGAA